MNVAEILRYYSSLLILQYIGKPKAVATVEANVTQVIMPQQTVETITFDPTPDAGYFTLIYGGEETQHIPYDVTASGLQDILRGMSGNVLDGGDAIDAGSDTVSGGSSTSVGSDVVDGGDAYGFTLGNITVTGSVADGFTVTFVGIDPPAELLEVGANTLTSGGDSVTITIAEIDETLPIAVQNAFNVTGPSIAVGVQLDVIGKYVGVSRTNPGFTGQITLPDDEYITLIQLAIIQNNNGSSLKDIVDTLFQFFGAEIVVYDYTNMTMEYSISSSIGTTDLVQVIVANNLLPKPMGVGVFVVIFDDVNAFGFEGLTDSGGFGDLSDALIGGKLATLYSP